MLCARFQGKGADLLAAASRTMLHVAGIRV